MPRHLQLQFSYSLCFGSGMVSIVGQAELCSHSISLQRNMRGTLAQGAAVRKPSQFRSWTCSTGMLG